MATASSAEARAQLVDALRADLIGPFELDPASREELPVPPSRWYLTGFLAPQGASELDDPTEQDELGAGDDLEDDEERARRDEPEPKQKRRLPASIGLSVLLPTAAKTVTSVVSWADYQLVSAEAPPGSEAGLTSPASRQKWRRAPREPVALEMPLDAAALAKGAEVPGAPGVFVIGQLAEPRMADLPPGTCALALFLVNRREGADPGKRDELFLFQARIEVRSEMGFVARRDGRHQASSDWDDRVLDLQFRAHATYAVGHGVSVGWPAGAVKSAWTEWLPQQSIPRIVTRKLDGLEVRMDALAALKADGVRAALGALPGAYAAWIAAQKAIELAEPERRQTREELLRRAEHARARVAEGIALLERDPQALDAFCRMNTAMAEAQRRRAPERNDPSWRLFQLAFVLLNLPSIADDAHPDRATVELVYFPTGGGKTEAYLGVIAVLLLLRRMRGRERPDQGLGVAVLLRYTLRLLTLDQLGRAATLICALELMREREPERLGATRFSVGLWVGRSATANRLGEVAKWITQFRNNPLGAVRSPFPLAGCPWCAAPFDTVSFELRPSAAHPDAVVVGCSSRECAFNPRARREGLPIVFVDEQVYRELPSFLIATVDKFALLPWRAEVGMLFGHAVARDEQRFYGAGDRPGQRGVTALPSGLRPPELVVQDELHLISGPLGTMFGLFETALEKLSRSRSEDGKERVAKIICSTATVRRAAAQICALFGRDSVAVFPPPGVDDGESFFAQVDRDNPGRLYLGVAAAGRALKSALLRTYVTLLSATQRTWNGARGGDRFADPYMTLVGYFNSLRELGGMRRLVEDEVRVRVAQQEDRYGRAVEGTNPRFANRRIGEPLELTSRESTASIAATKQRLETPYADKGHADVLLASNMISVGVDIERLGLMVVAGQPKSTSEYIQASSRVGRNAAAPGLVVTVYNVHKPRDRSHYERFISYHSCFYRFVEATSVTPFSGPALDRGLAAVMVGLTRHLDLALTPATGVMELPSHHGAAETAIAAFAERVGYLVRGDEAARKAAVDDLTKRMRSLLDSWQQIVTSNREEAGESTCYSPWDDAKQGKPLLFQVLDEDATRDSDEQRFSAPTSMRDVEAGVHLWLDRRPLTGRRIPDA